MGLKVPEELENFVRNFAEEKGYRVLEVSGRGGKIPTYEIILDKEGGINLEECAIVNKAAIIFMEENHINEEGFLMDVCSPGIDRALKTDKDYEWAKGKMVEVRTYTPIDERKSPIIGKLTDVSDSSIFLEIENGEKIEVDKSKISKARLKVEI